MGTRPPALQLEEHLTSDCIIGLYPQEDEATGNFLMRLNPGLPGLTSSHAPPVFGSRPSPKGDSGH